MDGDRFWEGPFFILLLVASAGAAAAATQEEEAEVEYRGPSTVSEGDGLRVVCLLPSHRFASWRRERAGAAPLVPDPWNRFRVEHGPRDPRSGRVSSTLSVLGAQLNHTGDYYCTGFSTLHHSLMVLPRDLGWRSLLAAAVVISC